MSKVNPVMKHAKPQPLKGRISVEEFMESIPAPMVDGGDVMIDNTLPEWVETTDSTLDPIIESNVMADQLDQLAGDVDGVTTAASMESYRRIFGQMTESAGFPRTEGVALESFAPTKGGKRQLVKAIRDHAQLIRNCANVALEDFVDNADDSVGSTVASYKQALATLSGLQTDITVPDKPIKIDSQKIWAMFHMNGKSLKPTDFNKEVNAVDEIAGIVQKATTNVVSAMSKTENDKNRELAENTLTKLLGGSGNGGKVLADSKEIHLMFNTSVKVSDGRAKFTKHPVPTGKGGKMSGGDWGWLAFWGIFFGPLGLIGAGIYRAVNGGTGGEHTERKDGQRQMHKFIDDVKTLAPIVDQMQKDIDQLSDAIKSAPEDKRALYKRSAAPVIELAAKTIEHITELTYGAKVLFEKISAD